MLAIGAFLAVGFLCNATHSESATNLLGGYDSFPIVGPSAGYLKENTGLIIEGQYRGYFYGNVAGGINTGAAWDQEIRLIGIYNFGFLAESLKGFTLTGGMRWRYGQNPNTFVGTTPPFQASPIAGGKYYRLRPFYLTYVTPELLEVKNLLTISAGWENPYDLFLQQDISKLFVNYSLYTSKGLGANIPWSSSYAAWGGYFNITPTKWFYAQAGLYMAIPEATATHNHGFDLQGSQMPGKPNSLFAIAEIGITPTIGPSQLPGKYAFGSYWYGAQDINQNGKGPPRYGFYWQADQQLYRPSSYQNTRGTLTNYKLAGKGLYFFSMFTYAPPSNNILPFYFQTGLVYEGLIPTRDCDNLCIAYGYGTHSKFNSTEQSQFPPSATSQAVLEINYDISLTKWLYFKPFYQLLINPASNNTVKNAHILGFLIYAAF